MKRKSQIFTFLYIVFPLIFVPYWAHHNGNNWFMLLGIATSYFGSICFFNEFGSILFVLFLALLAYCIYFGTFSIHGIYETLFLCMMWGFITALLAKMYKDMARQREEDIEDGLRES